MAVLLTVLSPGVFPAGIAMAENAGGWIPEGRAGHARVTESNGSVDSSEILEEVWDEEEPEENLATASDAILWSEPATPSDAVQWSEPATPSNLLLLAAQIPVTGDLWEDWNGNVNFPGEGTRESPYQLETLSHLMGLAESVAAGNDYEGCYFELTQSLDLGGIAINRGDWNPIGWYRSRAEMSGEVPTPFRGYFDGCGNTITGLKIAGELDGKTNLGLFGVIDGGSVENLEIQCDQVRGLDQVGILAGAVKNGAVIRNVRVSGYVYSGHNAGGIAAMLCGSGKGTLAGTQLQESDGSVIVENCRAEGISMNGAEKDGAVGGIAGCAKKAYLIDNAVITQNGVSDRIQGKGYVGGIAGVMTLSGIYNSYVNGTIGGNGSRAVGGIVGKYESGNLILARMAGVVSRTNNGSASREGTFVGTRDSSARFTYGTERDSRVSICLPIRWRRQSRCLAVPLTGITGLRRMRTSVTGPIWNASIKQWRDRLNMTVGTDSSMKNWKMASAILLLRSWGVNLPWKAIKRICRLPWIILHRALWGSRPEAIWSIFRESMPEMQTVPTIPMWQCCLRSHLRAAHTTGILIKTTRLRSGQGVW